MTFGQFSTSQNLVEMIIFAPFKCQVCKSRPLRPDARAEHLRPAVGSWGCPASESSRACLPDDAGLAGAGPPLTEGPHVPVLPSLSLPSDAHHQPSPTPCESSNIWEPNCPSTTQPWSTVTMGSYLSRHLRRYRSTAHVTLRPSAPVHGLSRSRPTLRPRGRERC